MFLAVHNIIKKIAISKQICIYTDLSSKSAHPFSALFQKLQGSHVLGAKPIGMFHCDVCIHNSESAWTNPGLQYVQNLIYIYILHVRNL